MPKLNEDNLSNSENGLDKGVLNEVAIEDISPVEIFKEIDEMDDKFEGLPEPENAPAGLLEDLGDLDSEAEAIVKKGKKDIQDRVEEEVFVEGDKNKILEEFKEIKGDISGMLEKRIKSASLGLEKLEEERNNMNPDKYALKKKYYEVEVWNSKWDQSLEILNPGKLAEGGFAEKVTLEGVEKEKIEIYKDEMVKSSAFVNEFINKSDFSWSEIEAMTDDPSPRLKEVFVDLENQMKKSGLAMEATHFGIFQDYPEEAISLIYDIGISSEKDATFNFLLDSSAIDSGQIADILFDESAGIFIDQEKIDAVNARIEQGMRTPFLNYQREDLLRKEERGVVHNFIRSFEETDFLKQKVLLEKGGAMLDSFLPKENREKIPAVAQEALTRFEEKYGGKDGVEIFSLAIATYGLSNLELLLDKIGQIESTLDKYDPSAIPKGTKTSSGFEYEVTESIAKIYDRDSAFGYKNDIQLATHSAGMRKDRDAFYEIASSPSYNPYMSIVQARLLQESGFVDFNFKKYPGASRNRHLSIVGETGIALNEDVYFVNSLMAMAQLSGVHGGNEVANQGLVDEKGFWKVGDSKQGGWRCEFKDLMPDSIEQFEKAVITGHNAGVAIQVCNKYFDTLVGMKNIGENAVDFEKKLIESSVLTKRFETEKERSIAYQWMKLKNDTESLIDQHNASFVDSEFNGYLINKDGEYIDTSDNIDVARNKSLIEEEYLKSPEFASKIHLEKNSLYKDLTPEFVNTMAYVNNIFLKAPTAEGVSSVNVAAALSTMKLDGEIIEGSAQQSIVETGELRRGYYYTQGASEEMVIHKSQVLLNRFNTKIQEYTKRTESKNTK